MTSDQDKNRQRMKQLLGKPGNGHCVDCGAAGRLEGESLHVGYYRLSYKCTEAYMEAVTS